MAKCFCRECYELFDFEGDKPLDSCPHCKAEGDMLGYSFEDDKEKMQDFGVLTREEFLKSYSYLNERDYAATLAAVGFIWVVENLGWNVSEYEQDGRKYAELEDWSPAGEDIIITVWHDGTWESFVDELESIYDEFDTEEHITDLLKAKENGLQGIPDVKTLVHDADAIDEMYLKLFETVRDKLDEMKYS